MKEEKILSERKFFGKELKKKRLREQLTFYAVAKKANIKIAQLRSIEKGSSAYTIDSLIKLTNALKLNFVITETNDKLGN